MVPEQEDYQNDYETTENYEETHYQDNSEVSGHKSHNGKVIFNS